MDRWIVNGATIIETADTVSQPVKLPKVLINNCFRGLIEPKYPADLPKMIEGLRRLAREPYLRSLVLETGDHCIEASSKAIVAMAIKTLESDTGCLYKTEIVQNYRETVTGASQIAMTKSPNKHNYFYTKIEPLDSEIIEAMKEQSDDSKLVSFQIKIKDLKRK